MPVKNWSDGNYVYGTDMDFITTSLVMRFADAAARSSTLVGDLAPTAGMVSYLNDTQTWWQYITVSSVGYWVPQPGTTVCSMYATATQTLTTAGTPYPVQLTGVVKNLSMGTTPTACWVANKFNPKVPGYYLVSGGCCYDLSATPGYRITYLQKNSLGTGAPVPGSGSEAIPGGTGYQTTGAIRETSVYLNGTTDYLEMIAQQGGTGVSLTLNVASPFLSSSFNAVYTGL